MAHVIPNLFGLALIATLGGWDLGYRINRRRKRRRDRQG
jgi:hypothetical protein